MRINRTFLLAVIGLIVLWILLKHHRRMEIQWNKYVSPPVEFQKLRESKNGKYKIWDCVFCYNAAPTLEILDIGIATQTSLHNVYELVDMAKSWTGSISVAIFLPGSKLMAFNKLLNHFIQCYGSIWKHRCISVHVVIPYSHPPEDDVLHVEMFTINQLQCESYIHPLNGKNYDNKIPYPVNLLRNVAIDGLSTSHVMVLDADMVPRERMHERLIYNQKLLKVPYQALVLPSFEIKKTVLPVNKRELLSDWDNGMVRPFYIKTCKRCQQNTDYKHWRQTLDRKSENRGYYVAWIDPWEPFYIAHASNVRYDERFEQYGFNRISQLCDMYMAGFKFYVLYDEFVLHKGFKDSRTFHAKKDTENKLNRLLYGKFKKEISSRYPNSNRHC